MIHYPYQTDLADDEFEIAPHTDTSFLTLLAPNDVPGLSIRTQSGKRSIGPPFLTRLS
jgi:isopenicillin N synthase-like dioxygenase